MSDDRFAARFTRPLTDEDQRYLDEYLAQQPDLHGLTIEGSGLKYNGQPVEYLRECYSVIHRNGKRSNRWSMTFPGFPLSLPNFFMRAPGDWNRVNYYVVLESGKRVLIHKEKR